MMKLASIFSESLDATGVKQTKSVVQTPKVSNQSRSPGPGPERPNSRPNRGPARCFLCNQMGHRSIECRTGRPVGNADPPPRRGPVFASACLTVPLEGTSNHEVKADPIDVSKYVIACCGTNGSLNLPVVRGTLDGMPVQVLRDTGCTGLLVKRCLVNVTALTGDKRVLIKVDASQEEVGVARCNIQSPVFSGTVDMMCVPTMICDVIVGNVPGAYPNVRDILPKVAPLVPERDGESEPTVSKVDIDGADLTCAVETRAQVFKQVKPLRALPVVKIPDLNVTAKRFKLAQASDETLTKCFEAALKPVEDDDKRNHYVVTGDLLYRTFNRSDGEEWMQLVVP